MKKINSQKNNIDIFILARLNSKRLPKKQLKKINDKVILKVLIERLRKSKEIRNIIVCTTKKETDDLLVDFLKKERILFFRGSEKDVLKRMLDAAKKFSTDIIIDVEGDKIYTDPTLVDLVVKQFSNLKNDFVIGSRENGIFEPTDHFVHGVCPTGFRTKILEKLCAKKRIRNTETGYKELFFEEGFCDKKFVNIPIKTNISEIRLTLDYPEDLKLARRIFSELGDDFSYDDILELHRRKPQIFNITESISKKWESHYKKNLVKNQNVPNNT